MPAPVPKRLQVKIALCEWLEGITPANGYQHDLSPTGGVVRVFRGRDLFGPETTTPVCAVLEPLGPDRDIDDAGSGRIVHEKMILLIQGWADSDLSATHPTDGADYLLADLKKRVGELIGNDLPPSMEKSYHNLYGLVSEIKVEPGTVRQPDQFSALAYCFFRVVLEFVELIDDPYATN
jgi:hypothetical protein